MLAKHIVFIVGIFVAASCSADKSMYVNCRVPCNYTDTCHLGCVVWPGGNSDWRQVDDSNCQVAFWPAPEGNDYVQTNITAYGAVYGYHPNPVPDDYTNLSDNWASKYGNTYGPCYNAG